jgi:hypothetical protein
VAAAEPGSLAAGPYAGLPQSIQDYLNRGATAAALDQALYDLGLANQPVAVSEADLSGDGKRDIVVSIYDSASESMPPAGDLLIFVCQAGSYALVYHEITEEPNGAPGIRYVQDLNADGRAELVSSTAICGAHTCFEAVKILAWDGASFQNRLVGESSDLAYPTVEVVDPEGDGVYDLQITGSGIGSAGAGPQRSLVRLWRFATGSGQWEPAGDTPGPSDYRIHMLHDAEAAARKGAWDAALLLYQRVIHDTTLLDFVDPAIEQADLAAYARYKAFVVATLQANEALSKSLLSELENTYPPGSRQRPFVEMALAFLQAFTEDGQAAACQAVRDYASAHIDQVLLPLGPAAFGYGNPEITAEDVCPW